MGSASLRQFAGGGAEPENAQISFSTFQTNLINALADADDGGTGEERTLPDPYPEAYASVFSFGVVDTSGGVTVWGVNNGSDLPNNSKLHTNVSSLTPGSQGAWTAVRLDGEAIAWGGYNPNGVGPGAPQAAALEKMASGVNIVAPGNYSFGAMKDDGTAFAWGKEEYLPSSTTQEQLVNVTNLVATRYSFIALRGSSAPVVFGHATYGISIPSAVGSELVGSTITRVKTSNYFAVFLRDDGRMFTVYDDKYSSTLNERAMMFNMSAIFETGDVAISGVTNDGSVFVWYGSESSAPNSVAVTGTVNKMVASEREFCVLTNSNVAYAYSVAGSILFQVSNVRDIVANRTSFAFVGADDSMIEAPTQHDKSGGKLPDGGISDVNFVAGEPNTGAFCAVHNDGSITAWGYLESTTWEYDYETDEYTETTTQTNTGGQNAPIMSNVVDVVSHEEGFCAIQANGSFQGWGNGTHLSFTG